MNTVEVLKGLADETRLRMANLLMETEDLCSCEIEAILELNQSNASRHLSRLRSVGVVVATRRGHWVHYSLRTAPESYGIVQAALEAGRNDVPILSSDRERLISYLDSGYTCDTVSSWAASKRSLASAQFVVD